MLGLHCQEIRFCPAPTKLSLSRDRTFARQTWDTVLSSVSLINLCDVSRGTTYESCQGLGAESHKTPESTHNPPRMQVTLALTTQLRRLSLARQQRIFL